MGTEQSELAGYRDIIIQDHSYLRVVYEVTIGDLMIVSLLSLLLLYAILNGIRKLLWRS